MRTDASRGKRAVAADVWRLMASFAMSSSQTGRHMVMLKELGLTPGHLKMLGVLRSDEARPMGSLADACGCDASMATWLVDRLEDRKLVERRTVPTDRRVKAVALTPLGVRTKEKIFRELYEPPPSLLELDTESLETLRRELSKLRFEGPPFWPQRGTPEEAKAAVALRRNATR